MQENKRKIETTSFSLHVMAMLFMLCDHLWATVVPGNDWMNCIGRLAFPIYAFLIVEGYFHTRSLKKYVSRLLLAAVLSEIPFNLMVSGSVFFPMYQNVLWTFLLAIGLIHWNESVKGKALPVRLLVGAAVVGAAYIGGTLAFADYHSAGILTVLVFYVFRGKTWRRRLGQLLCLGYINFGMFGGFAYVIPVFGQTLSVARQGFAVLALIPIWLYRGKQGLRGKALQYTYYAFYPVHLLVLGLLRVL
ncbi:MAG: conjugal transfer protein TraX [Oscillospiraceae bacterium]|nr:conjugal transfer protein TraX [Oscillospiraceae bacterium]